VNTQRRQRLESVIHPLVSLDCFSRDQAKKCCSESSPGYVTRTLRLLVRDGLLKECRDGDRVLYRWQWHEPRGLVTRQWIDRQVDRQVGLLPTDERPRERLIRKGAAALSDAELLAILIRVGVPPESAMQAGQRIAHQFCGRWHDLPRCTPSELRLVTPAATPTSYTQIMAGIELGKRITNTRPPFEGTESITSTGRAIDFCQHAFHRLANDGVQEEFHLVTLDTKHKPIGTHQITLGTLDASLVHPREVFRPAIRDAAAAVLLVHNHPSGDPTPSREDRQVTGQLTEAGKLLRIQVPDHIIVAKDGCHSIRDSG